MDNLKAILLQEMQKYAKKGLNNQSYLTLNELEQVYTVATISVQRGERIAFTSLFARLIGERIIIEVDKNNKTLLDALLQARIPREQIVLAYAGEPVEEPA